DPRVVSCVDVVVDVRQGAQLGQGVAHAVDVGAVVVHRRAHRHVQVRHQVRQRVDLDDRDDAQVGEPRLGHDVADRVDVLGLVPRQLVRAELTVGGERGAVPTGQVVDHDLDVERAAPVGLVLQEGLLEVRLESQGTTGDAAGGNFGGPA